MNQLNIAGRIGRDAETRYSQSGKVIATFAVAVSEYRDGEEQTLWVRCTMFGERAEKLAQYLTKGTPVAVTGRAGVSAWADKQSGEAKAALELLVNNVTLLGGKSDQADRPAPAPAAQRRAPAPAPAPALADMDDDIPF